MSWCLYTCGLRIRLSRKANPSEREMLQGCRTKAMVVCCIMLLVMVEFVKVESFSCLSMLANNNSL